VNNDGEMKAAFQSRGPKAREGVVIEEFIQGEEYSLDTSLKGKIWDRRSSLHPHPLEVMSNPWISGG
jgi:phosphoribosylamine-glycine ligase